MKTESMLWWNKLSSLRKTQICDTNIELLGSIRRYESLTESEIELLYLSTNIYDIRLDNIEPIQQTQVSLREQLDILRLFANKLGLYDAADFIRK